MDLFFWIMQSDIKAYENNMMLKNSILKASTKIYNQKDLFITRLQNDFEAFLDNLN